MQVKTPLFQDLLGYPLNRDDSLRQEQGQRSLNYEVSPRWWVHAGCDVVALSSHQRGVWLACIPEADRGGNINQS